MAILGLALAICGRAPGQLAELATPLSEQGMASWYGRAFKGHRAANGEIYDPQQLTAAHRTLPFGTLVRVRRLDSESSIVVRINDRGPFVDSRIIDLSYAAARLLGSVNPGLIPVALDILGSAEDPPQRPPPPAPVPEGRFAVQAATYRDSGNARRAGDILRAKFGAAAVSRGGDFWRLLVGGASSEAHAQSLAQSARETAGGFRSAYVVPASQ